MNGQWSWDTFIDSIPYITKGLHITFFLTIYSFIVALLLGFVWLYLRKIPFKPLNWLFRWIMEFIRSTPPLVQLFFFYYSWPLVPIVGSTIGAFPSAVIVLGIHFSTYIGEVYRSGIDAVEEGQWEAATALNFSLKDKWLKIVLPQALPPTIPMLGNYLIILFKEVPLASTIGVLGILGLADEYNSKYWSFVEPLTVVAILFLLLSYPSSLIIRYLEKKLNTKFHKEHV